MLTFKKTIVPVMSALFISTAIVAPVQAQSETTQDAAHPCGTDGSGDVKIVPCPAADAEASAEASVDGANNMVGDLDGDEPLSASQQVAGNAESGGQAQTDLSGDEPTNQPIIDTTEGND